MNTNECAVCGKPLPEGVFNCAWPDPDAGTSASGNRSRPDVSICDAHVSGQGPYAMCARDIDRAIRVRRGELDPYQIPPDNVEIATVMARRVEKMSQELAGFLNRCSFDPRAIELIMKAGCALNDVQLHLISKTGDHDEPKNRP